MDNRYKWYSIQLDSAGRLDPGWIKAREGRHHKREGVLFFRVFSLRRDYLSLPA